MMTKARKQILEHLTKQANQEFIKSLMTEEENMTDDNAADPDNDLKDYVRNILEQIEIQLPETD